MSGINLDICFVTKSFPPRTGGGETYAYEVVNNLGKRGHIVDVYTQSIPDKKPEPVELHENVSVYRITKSRKKLVTFETLFFSLYCRRSIDVSDYDIIHGTLMPASVISYIINKPKIPFIVTSHGTSVGEFMSHSPETFEDYLLKYIFHPMNILFDYITAHRMDHTIGISEHSREQLINLYRIESSKVSLIPHGVDIDRFNPRKKDPSLFDDNKVTILYVGRLAPRKGLDLALETISKYDSEDIEFIIVGAGRHKTRLEKKTEDMGILNHTKFMGHVAESQLPFLYASTDIFLLPSRYEGYGLVLLEAMASGTPVIGTDVGGIPTVIDHGKTGLLVERTVSELQYSLDKLIYNTNYRRKIGENARKKAEELSWENITDKLEDLYIHLVGN